MLKQKGGFNVVDDCCDSDNFVAAGVGDRLYDGLFYSYSAGHCHYCCAGQSHSGAETGLERVALKELRAKEAKANRKVLFEIIVK